MTKNELIGLLNINMMNAIRLRDMTDSSLHSEEYGYYNGQYRSYETVISLLTTIDIESIGTGDSRMMR